MKTPGYNIKDQSNDYNRLKLINYVNNQKLDAVNMGTESIMQTSGMVVLSEKHDLASNYNNVSLDEFVKLYK